jgi:sec-independent protein translocase protein TatA
MPFGIQPWHIIVIVVVALVIFGPSKLPELGRSLGKSITEFRRGTKEMTESFKTELSQPEETAAHPAIPMQSIPVQTVPAPAPAAPVQAPVQAPVTNQPAAAAGAADASVPQTSGGNFCSNCGASNAPAARFCNNCGAQIRA